MNSGSDNKKDKTNASELDATRSFLDNLPQVKKPEPKKSALDDHLAFLNSLPKAAPKPAVEPVEEISETPVTLEGVRASNLDVHEGTESPNMGPQETIVPKPVAPVSEEQVELDDVELDEDVIAAAEAAMNA